MNALVGDTIQTGQRWRAVRNPYPLKGAPWMSIPWDLDKIYEVIEVVDMTSPGVGRCDFNIVAFKAPEDKRPMAGWEIGEDSFRLGFVRAS